MTPFLSRPHSLRDEIESVIHDDDRKPLARAPATRTTAVFTERETERRVEAELRRLGTLESGQIAARLLLREEDVERALLKLALAQRVVKLRGARWKSCPWSTEETV